MVSRVSRALCRLPLRDTDDPSRGLDTYAVYDVGAQGLRPGKGIEQASFAPAGMNIQACAGARALVCFYINVIV